MPKVYIVKLFRSVGGNGSGSIEHVKDLEFEFYDFAAKVAKECVTGAIDGEDYDVVEIHDSELGRLTSMSRSARDD